MPLCLALGSLPASPPFPLSLERGIPGDPRGGSQAATLNSNSGGRTVPVLSGNTQHFTAADLSCSPPCREMTDPVPLLCLQTPSPALC